MQLKLSTLVGGNARNFRPALLATACLTGLVLLISPERGHSQTDDVSPFVVTPAITTNAGVPTLSIAFRVPEHHHLYADELDFKLAGHAAQFSLPAATAVTDKFSGKSKLMYLVDFVATSPLPAAAAKNLDLTVDLHGCSDEECRFPETREWLIHPDHSIASADDSSSGEKEVASTTAPLVRGFQVVGRTSGFLNSQRFVEFLNQTRGVGAAAENALGSFAGLGMAATISLILLGGLALNFTPCILPMIPINLAILGAGAQGGNRRRGFALGAAYGGGMALAYGTLGLVVVLTGANSAR